jgi:hypothetical protein
MTVAKKQAPRFQVGDWVSLFFGPQRVKAKVIEDRGLLGVGGRRIYRVSLAFDPDEPMIFEMPEADLKPTTQPSQSTAQQVFMIHYSRVSDTETWEARTEWDRNRLIVAVKADMTPVKGAVAYSTARGESVSAKDDKNVLVTVRVESDPQFDDANPNDHPEVLRIMAEEARELADELFKVQHPNALIKHNDRIMMGSNQVRGMNSSPGEND